MGARLLIVVFFLIGISACNRADESYGDGVPLEQSGGEPAKITWGDLPCQENQSCQTAVLNLTKVEIESFFDKEMSVGSLEGDTFACGVLFVHKWLVAFPEFADMESEYLYHAMEFSVRLIDTPECKIRSNYKDLIHHYFSETEEYKNEIR